MSIKTSPEDFICNIGGVDVDFYDLSSAASITFPRDINTTVETPSCDVNILSARIPAELTIPFIMGSSKFSEILGASRAGVLGSDGFIQFYDGLRYNLQGIAVMSVEEQKQVVESGDVVGQPIKFRIENTVQI
jgi:hypothetical protein